MSKTIKNVKLTTRQWELLVDSLACMEVHIDDMIQDQWDGYSHKTLEVLSNLRNKLGAYG
tara:strand:+ start:1729 stop:1908 length:180 start_codon:yes stop_codon:yes gene_type:complete